MRTLANRLLPATGGAGGFSIEEYEMSPDEVTYWREHAALLDPDAYELVAAQSTSRTVPVGERWYLLTGWWLQSTGGASGWFHRHGDIWNALPLAAGTTLTTWDGTAPGPNGVNSTSHMYLCKPSLVVDGDARYSTDPRGLLFERLQRIGELPQYTIGVTDTANNVVEAAFPTDFTNGLVIHQSVHDMAWCDLSNAADTGGIIVQDEISDSDRIRFAYAVTVPFKRTTLTKIKGRGATRTEGRGVIRYLKLPSDW